METEHDLTLSESEIRQLMSWHQKRMEACQQEAVDHQKRGEQLREKITFKTLTVAQAGATYKS